MRISTHKILAFLLISGLFLAFTKPGDRFFDIAKNLDIYATVFKELNTFYVDEVDPKKATETSIEALLKSFDPYTVYYPEDEIDDFLQMTTGKYQGIGIILSEIDKTQRITFIEENSPAHRAGLGIGDQILAINGTRLQDTPETEPAVLMKGASGTNVNIEVLQVGKSTPQIFSIKRETVQIKNVVNTAIIQPGVGYILLEDFNASASKEVKNAIVELKKQGMKELILDLRNNPGGLLTQAIDICNLFLPKGTKIVETRGKVEEWNKSYLALNQAIDTETPIVVLINNRTASAAEIVAGVLQDYDRAVILGQKSYGKGLVQVTRDLPYRTKMKITTAKYYIPSGRCIQALDYQHKNADGSAKAFQDSSAKTFYTKNGRKVVDGGGILPDQVNDKKALSHFAQALLKQDMFFLFASEYHANHPSIAPADQFTADAALLEQFKNTLSKSKFSYESPVEHQVKKLLEATREQSDYADLQKNILAQSESWNTKIDREFSRHTQELKPLLEQEMIMHYYLQKGLNAWSVRRDPSILAAIELLGKPTKFASILTRREKP
ncbi:S41 family peptidase [Aquirufa sp. 5-AUSEE-100C1]